MDERCRIAHAKLLAGTCPWCGQPIINGQIPGENWNSTSEVVSRPVSGTTLKQLVVNAGPLNVVQAAQYTEEVAKQLADIHRAGELYCDVRPGTIFLDEAGTPHLAAVVATAVEVAEESLPSSEQSVSESVDCLSPERALASCRYDARSDIYSLGCTFYFLLSGRPPFPSGTISERLLKLQTAKPDSIRNLRPDVPRALVAICEKMMAKKPSERFQTATSVADAVAKWQREM